MADKDYQPLVAITNYSPTGSPSSFDQAVINALTNVANGIAKKTPQNPHIPPKNNTATMMYKGCNATASENKIGTIRLPSNA